MSESAACKPKVVVIGASAGGLNALTNVLSALPPDLPVPVLVVQHLDPKHASIMAEILGKRARIRIEEAQDGMLIEPGTVYIAPPNSHMLVEQGKIHLTQSERVHFVRPSVDLLFESAAAEYKGRVAGVILTGSGLDGVLGVRAIRKTGGLNIVQDPETAQSSGMPTAAIATGAVDMILPLEEIGEAIVKAVTSEE